MAAIKLFLGQYGMFIAGAVVLALGVYVGALKLQLGSAQGQLEKANGIVAKQSGQILEWQSAYKILTSKTAEQNEAIEKLKTAEKTAQAKRVEANKKATAIAEARAGDIFTANKRLATNQTCSAAVASAKNDLRGAP